MELDFEPKTIAVSLGMWVLILFMIWFVPIGFKETKIKILFSICALPLTYLMTAWQLNR